MNKTILASTMMGFALLVTMPQAADASEQSREANPHGLEYSDIQVEVPEFDEPFQRDGRLVPPGKILQVVPGTSADDVRELIGGPIQTGQGARGPEWDYNLKLDMDDEDFIVCQYKVVFDERSEKVVETSWRRYQCRDAMAAQQAKLGS